MDSSSINVVPIAN